MSYKNINLIGQRFHKLIVLSKVRQEEKTGKTLWLCQCDCGKTAERSTSKLRCGQTHSCGCYNFTNGGATKIPGYTSWACMNNRCYRKGDIGYHKYGGAGIQVCGHLRESPHNLFALIGARPSKEHSIDRIDSAKNYSCGKCDCCISNGWTKNVKWSTRVEQNRNRNNMTVTMFGRSMSLSEWATETGVPKWRIKNRLRSGYRHEDVIFRGTFSPRLPQLRRLGKSGVKTFDSQRIR